MSVQTNVLNNISKFDYCFGCGVCASACPRKAISMHLNAEGFYQPLADSNICNSCGICLEVCAFNHREVCQEFDQPVCSAAWSNDRTVRLNCTTGGTAYEIERLALSLGYKVCGVRYNVTDRRAYHFIAGNEEQLKDTIGSKYIQSCTFPAFSQFTKDGKYLVVGTPCQIDSLRRYIRKRKFEDNFILVDIFCHGVPSILMWHKYCDYIGIKDAKIVKFRDKRYGWHNSYSITIIGDGHEWFSSFSKGDLFYSFFLGDRCPNMCCVRECKYKQKNSAADIRVGDLWGHKYIHNQEGVNAVLAFTQKGREILEKLSSSCTLEPCDFSTVAELQMKKNVVRSLAYHYVLHALKTNKTLLEIHRYACILESPTYIIRKLKYYWHRLPSKLGVINEN